MSVIPNEKAMMIGRHLVQLGRLASRSPSSTWLSSPPSIPPSLPPSQPMSMSEKWCHGSKMRRISITAERPSPILIHSASVVGMCVFVCWQIPACVRPLRGDHLKKGMALFLAHIARNLVSHIRYKTFWIPGMQFELTWVSETRVTWAKKEWNGCTTF